MIQQRERTKYYLPGLAMLHDEMTTSGLDRPVQPSTRDTQNQPSLQNEGSGRNSRDMTARSRVKEANSIIFKCPTCGKTYDRLDNIKRHIRSRKLASVVLSAFLHISFTFNLGGKLLGSVLNNYARRECAQLQMFFLPAKVQSKVRSPLFLHEV